MILAHTGLAPLSHYPGGKRKEERRNGAKGRERGKGWQVTGWAPGKNPMFATVHIVTTCNVLLIFVHMHLNELCWSVSLSEAVDRSTSLLPTQYSLTSIIHATPVKQEGRQRCERQRYGRTLKAPWLHDEPTSKIISLICPLCLVFQNQYAAFRYPVIYSSKFVGFS